jgi:hypothetical protein
VTSPTPPTARSPNPSILSWAASGRPSNITLTFSRRPTDAQLREAKEKDQPNKEMHQAWAAAVETQIRTKGDKLLERAYPIQAWRLGNVSWLALGGEVVIDYSIRLRREVSQDLWVFGYSNDVMAYIPSERVLKEGRYEVTPR